MSLKIIFYCPFFALDSPNFPKKSHQNAPLIEIRAENGGGVREEGRKEIVKRVLRRPLFQFSTLCTWLTRDASVISMSTANAFVGEKEKNKAFSLGLTNEALFS